MRSLVALIALLAVLAAGAAPVAAGLPGAPRLSDEARDRFQAGLAAIQAGDWAQAASTFGDPGWAATPLADYALLFHAESLLRLGDEASARAAAARAADPSADVLIPGALLKAAGLLADAGDDAGAAGLYRRFLDKHPDHAATARARYALGEALLRAGQAPQAARAFQELWLVLPASPYADIASQQLRALTDGGLAVPPPAARDRVARAERLLASGRADAAAKEAEAVLADTPPADLQLRALRVLVDAFRRAGRYDAAQAAAARGLATAPPDRRATWLLEAARLQHARAREQALRTLDQLLRDYPKSLEAPEALLLKARVLEAAGRQGEADAAYQRLAADYPDAEEAGVALWRLGWLAWFRGNWSEGASLWGRLGTIRGGQPYREPALYWTARAREAGGDREGAQRQFALLLQDAPRSYYGVLAAQRGAWAAPRAVSAASLPPDPLQPLQGDTRYARAEALRAVGLGDWADEELDEIGRRALGEPKRLYAVSAAFAQESRYHLALRILRRHFQPVARSGAATTPRTFWEILYPLGWRAELTGAAARASVDPFLVAAVVREESSFFPQARSRAGARGLMQLMPETARPMAQARRLSFNEGEVLDDPAANLDMGTAYLGGLLRQFGDPRLATAAYNAGPARVREWWAARRSDDVEVWVEEIPFNETRGFVKRVMLSWDEYRRLYGAEAGTAQP
ncbi:MAG TPA: transglycosylase SLT domain-containing protein [Methylomirabilota bacterium]|nr:transglycosylase SLT domain-containing protein [Methylomirabilota bacterium]